MRKIILFLFFVLSGITTINAEVYTLVTNHVIFYRQNANSPEVRVRQGSTIPSEEVYIRMHKEDREGSTFEIKSFNGSVYVCSAPNQWKGLKLKDCIIGEKNRRNMQNRELSLVSNVITLGDALTKRTPKFHCLFAFVGQFDDTQWNDIPFSDKDIAHMQQAVNVVRSQEQYLRGKQYILTAEKTTKTYLTHCMDSILKNTGEGDFIFLYFSSHGEKDASGQFNFITKNTYHSKGGFTNSLTKDEINRYVNQLTAKKARVLFFLDACYAGAVMDESIQGEAAYYLSTNGYNPSYYNRLFGSPFAIALTEVMSGSLNDKYAEYFKENQVQVTSLGTYLSKAVFEQSEQQTISDGHEFSPSFVLWNIHNVPKKESLAIQLLADKAKHDLAEMINLGDRYYEGNGTPVDFYKAFDCYKKASSSKNKEIKAKALLQMSKCFYYGNPEQDSILAFEYELEAAQLGNVKAMTYTGLDYFNGYGTKEDKQEAFRWFRQAAQKGFAEAQYYLGLCYDFGNGVSQDKTKALKWLTKAAEQCYADAQSYFGICYFYGEGVPQDYAKAVEWFAKAAEQGNAEAQNNLGCCYRDGEGVPQNFDKAVYWFTKAAELGNARAQYNLSVCYYYGRSVPQDYDKAVEWMTKAAEQGYAYAQYDLGICYYTGKGVTQDYVKAVEWFTKAAEQGNVYAQNMLGICYYNGEGVTQDYAKALELYTKAAEQGDVYAQLNIGDFYYSGEGATQDYAKAVYWYTKAAEQGNAYAQNILGICYRDGKGVSQNHDKTVYWFIKAAEQNDTDAQYNLGNYYHDGKGVSKDYAKAVYWYTKAAEQDNDKAKTMLGYCYYNGEGVTQDYAKAVECYTKAAEQGNLTAQYNLGLCYYYGKGVKQDKTKALSLIRLAADKGYKSAIKFIEKYGQK